MDYCQDFQSNGTDYNSGPTITKSSSHLCQDLSAIAVVNIKIFPGILINDYFRSFRLDLTDFLYGLIVAATHNDFFEGVATIEHIGSIH